MTKILWAALAALAFSASSAGQDLGSVTTSAYGSITAASTSCIGGACVWIAAPLNTATITVQLSGTFTATVQFETSTSGQVYSSIANSADAATSATAAGTFTFNMAANRIFRVRASAFTSGPIRVDISSSNTPLGGGGAVSGSVTVNGQACTVGSSCTVTAAPTAHASTHATGAGDPITAASIGAAASNASTLVNGTSCALGSSCAAPAASLTTQYIDYTAGSGGASIANKPTLGTAAAKNVGATSADVAAGNATMTVNGVSCALGSNCAPGAASLSGQYIDWNSVAGGNSIANKPTLGTAAAKNTGTTSADVAVGNAATTVNGTSCALGSTCTPAAPSLTAQYIDWNSGSGGNSIANKPTVAALSSTNPVMDGSVAVGVGTTAARADHVHASDTSRAASNATLTVNGTSCALGASCTVADATKMVNPMTTAGDLIVGGSSGAPGRLAGGALDTVYLGGGAGVAGSFSAAIPSCNNATTSKVLYNTTSHAFECGTDQSSAYVSVVDANGAVGNGSTDDTTAFQTALTAGGRVTTTAGKTYIVSTLSIPSNTTLECGENSVIKKLAGSTTVYLLVPVTNAVNVAVRGCTFDDNSVAQTTGQTFMMFFGGLTNFVFERNILKNSGSPVAGMGGLYVYNSAGIVRQNNVQNTVYGVHIQIDPNNRTDRQVIVEQNVLDGSKRNGIYLSNPGGTQKTGNVVIESNTITSVTDDASGTGATGNGIVNYQTDNTRIYDNVIRTTRFSGIRVSKSAHVDVRGNLVDGSQETSIYAELGTYGSRFSQNRIINFVSGLALTNVAGRGIDMPNVGDHNTFVNGTHYALWCEHDDCSDNTIDGVPIGVVVGFGSTSHDNIVSGVNCQRTSTSFPPMVACIAIDKSINTGSDHILAVVRGTTVSGLDVTPVDLPSAVSITAITAANPAVVTFNSGTQPANSTVVCFAAVGGMTQINGLCGAVSASTSTTFAVAIDSSAFSAFTSPTGGQKSVGFKLYSSGTTLAFAVPTATSTSAILANGKTFNVSNSLTLTGTDGSSVALGAGGTVTYTIASGATAMATSAISSTACATVVTVGATGVATTDAIEVTPNADITAVTGYTAATAGRLIVYPYPTANNVNFKICNPTSGSVTPGAVTLNWRVVR